MSGNGGTSLEKHAWNLKRKQKYKTSERTKDEKLKLQPNNIKYIIVKSEKERINIINEILRIFEKEENDCINLLISKVCSSEQMKEDY